jgi:hypothetical protein
MERSIEYDSPEQREQVQEIIDRTSRQMFEHLRESRYEASQILDSARSELSEILSEEQMRALERHFRRRMGPRMRDRMGPPGAGPPPGLRGDRPERPPRNRSDRPRNGPPDGRP